MLHHIAYTLKFVETRGRDNLRALLLALEELKAGEKARLPLIYAALSSVSVAGDGNIDRLLGCLEALERLMEEEHDRHHQ